MRLGVFPAVLILAVGLLVGCPRERGSNVPMPTDGPNQVVIKVPGMT
jgi:hypothetical protein